MIILIELRHITDYYNMVSPQIVLLIILTMQSYKFYRLL